MTGSSWLQEGQRVFFVSTKLVLLVSNVAPLCHCPFAQPLSSVIVAETDARTVPPKWKASPRLFGQCTLNTYLSFTIDHCFRSIWTLGEDGLFLAYLVQKSMTNGKRKIGLSWHKEYILKGELNCTRKMKQTKIVVIFPLIPTVKFPRLYSVGKLVKIKPEK